MAYKNAFNSAAVLDHFRTEDAPFLLPRKGSQPVWADKEFHDEAYHQGPERYALSAVAEKVGVGQQVRVLFQLLERSRVGLSEQTRTTLERVTVYLMTILHPDQVVTAFLAARRVRANHKHTRRAILKYILNHPCIEDMAVRRRPSLVECLEHAMGKNTARACAKAVLDGKSSDAYLRRHLLRFGTNPARTLTVIRILYHRNEQPERKRAVYTKVHEEYGPAARIEAKRPKTITATNRGDIAATLVHLYRGGTNKELHQALDRYVTEGAAALPRFDGRIALVLDASESTKGYGEREYACISQSVALSLVLEKCCPQLKVYQVGGLGEPPKPQGGTDLAIPLLHALEDEPDLVAILSDGHENVYRGDLSGVAAALPGAGIQTPVVFCHSKFTDKDDLGLRCPAPSLPSMEFWHQNDFRELAISLFTMARTGSDASFFRQHLLQKLDRFEEEKKPWLNLN